MWLLTHAPGIQDALAGLGLSELTLKPLVAALGFANAVFLGFVAGLRARAERLPRADHRHAEDGLAMALPLSYNVRNVRVRWQLTLLAVGGIALVVAVFAVLLSMSEGFAAALRSTGRTDNAMIVQRGSGSELTSGVPLADRNMIVVDDRVARDAAGQPLASWEWVVVIGLPRAERRPAGQRHPARGDPARLRGAGRHRRGRGPQLHPRPRRGDRREEAHQPHRGPRRSASDVKYQQKRFKIVGLFESTGGAFESEIWGDYDTLGAIFQRGAGSNSLVVRMKDPATIPELDRWIRAQPQMQLQAVAERKYYEDQAGPLAKTLQGLATFVAVVMGIGAVFGAINTMYAIVAARTREIGTLRALGFSRRSILVSFLIESVILALVGGAIGCLLAFPMNGFSTGTGQTQSFSEIAFAFRITPGIIATGMIFAAGHGRAGRPAARAARGPAADHLGASRSMTRSSLAVVLCLLAAGCTDRDAPRPVPVPDQERAADATRPLSSREAIPPAAPGSAVDPDDPAEPGIPDLARLARYVYKTMQRHEEVCPFENPFRDQLHFALEIEVKKGRMTRVGLGHVGLESEAAGRAGRSPEAQWPRELTAYAACLAPHLQTVAMAPSPADGTYEPVYSFGGQAAGRPGP